MKNYKFVILGAGPAGLTFANRLLQMGENDFIVLEKEKEAGGLCRSEVVDGSPLDTGGGHFLDVKDRRVLDFLFEFMPEKEWNLYRRDSRIEINHTIINSPIESNIWQMKLEDQVEYLKAIAIAGCNWAEPMPERFVDWIYWKLGEKIASDYMIPYNQKMFGEDLNSLGTYWLDKLPNVSFEETLISCLTQKAYGTQPGHAEFYYPKEYGYGELWLRMAKKLGGKIRYGINIEKFNFEERYVNGIYCGDIIISTIPWKSIKRLEGIPDRLKKIIAELKYSSIVVDYVPDNLKTDAHWIYYPDMALDYHRILVRHNFCPASNGYWTETNLSRFDRKEKQNFFINEYAYPLNTIGKNERMKELLEWNKEKSIYGLGRWGEWQHYNSDVVVAKALDLADSFRRTSCIIQM